MELWDPDKPRLYRLRTELVDGKTGQVLDRTWQNVGFKEAVLSPQEGLILNGRKLELKGCASTTIWAPWAQLSTKTPCATACSF